jgi:hypothetical protein
VLLLSDDGAALERANCLRDAIDLVRRQGAKSWSSRGARHRRECNKSRVDCVLSRARARLQQLLAAGNSGYTRSDHPCREDLLFLAPRPKVDEPPSFYFKRQFWATFEDERAGVLTRELIGVERLMWGSDYPHTEGTFPHSREQIAKDFAGISEADVSQMVVGNAARLYGLTA